jgi:hypothetical protein
MKQKHIAAAAIALVIAWPLALRGIRHWRGTVAKREALAMLGIAPIPATATRVFESCNLAVCQFTFSDSSQNIESWRRASRGLNAVEPIANSTKLFYKIPREGRVAYGNVQVEDQSKQVQRVSISASISSGDEHACEIAGGEAWHIADGLSCVFDHRPFDPKFRCPPGFGPPAPLDDGIICGQGLW